jgi:MFS family permease
MPAQTTTSHRAAPVTGSDHRRRWWILAVLGIAQLMVVLDASVVNIALPSAQKALHFSNDSRQWVITAYALAFGSLLLVGGRIRDLFLAATRSSPRSSSADNSETRRAPSSPTLNH